ncbi:MAG: CAP domain-containing protein [Candidatus Edwardsbacteria bacterium]
MVFHTLKIICFCLVGWSSLLFAFTPLQAGCANAQTHQPVTGFTLEEMEQGEQEMIRLVNAERTKRGLMTYDFDEGLRLMARKHSEDMCRRHYFSHQSPEGKTPQDRKEEYYPKLIGGTGENIHQISVSPGFEEQGYEMKRLISEAHRDLMCSPKHKKNILSKKFTHIGIGFFLTETEMLVTQNFAEEVALSDELLPKIVQNDSIITVKGEVRGKTNLNNLQAYLVIPDPKKECDNYDGTYSIGGYFLPVEKLTERKFKISFSLDKGKGDYELKLGERNYFYSGIKLIKE